MTHKQRWQASPDLHRDAERFFASDAGEALLAALREEHKPQPPVGDALGEHGIYADSRAMQRYYGGLDMLEALLALAHASRSPVKSSALQPTRLISQPQPPAS